MASSIFARGTKAWGHCERCGDRLLLKKLRYDGHVTGLQVCDDCWDPRHPQETVPVLVDPIALYDPTGDQDKTSAKDTSTPDIFDPDIF